MIIARTPYRISFFGGGTDYPEWYNKNQGSVISTSINKYCYITIRFLPNFFDYTHRLRYFLREEVNSIDEIKHPSIRETLRYLKIDAGIDLVHHGDLPAQSGVGSSSTFTVCLLHALHSLNGTLPSKYQLATEAINIEQNLIGEAVGSQDQTAAAFGGFNRIDFGGPRLLNVTPIIGVEKRLEELQSKLMLFFTGMTRSAETIAAEQIKETKQKVVELNEMVSLVDEAQRIITSKQSNLNSFGVLLGEQWKIKKQMSSKISNQKIDDIYNLGISSGAKGGKLLGAGSGGFIVFYVDEEFQSQVRSAMHGLLEIPVKFDYSGSQIVYHSASSM